MSTLALVETSCTNCGVRCDFEAVIMASFDRRPDLRTAVLDGSFNRVRCEACHNTMVLQRGVGTWDWGRQQVIYCWPTWAEVHWRDLAQSTARSIERNLTHAAPPAMRAAIDTLKVRTVFGYDQLRDKLVVWDAGLDEVQVESAKVALLAGKPEWARAHVWLWEVTPQHLRWVIAVPGSGAHRLETSHRVLADPLPGDLSSLDLRADPYRSFRRWLITPRPADPLAFDLQGISHPHAGREGLQHPFTDPDAFT